MKIFFMNFSEKKFMGIFIMNWDVVLVLTVHHVVVNSSRHGEFHKSEPLPAYSFECLIEWWISILESRYKKSNAIQNLIKGQLSYNITPDNVLIKVWNNGKKPSNLFTFHISFKNIRCI